MGIWRKLKDRLFPSDQTKLIQSAQLSLAKAREQKDLDGYLTAIRDFHRAGQGPWAAETAKEALSRHPGNSRVLRLISRLYASGGQGGSDSGMMLISALRSRKASVTDVTETTHLMSKKELGVLSLFPAPSFERLVESSRLVRLEDGDVLFEPGQSGDSIFLITSGLVQVLGGDKGVEKERLRMTSGGVLGVFSYLSGRPRAATVRSLGETCLLELSAEVLQRETAHDVAFQEVLLRFCRDRLLLNMIGALPGFRDLEYSEKARLLTKFRYRKFQPGEELLHEGEEQAMLGLVLRGQIRALRRRGSMETELVTMEVGDAFGAVGSPPCSPADADLEAGSEGARLALLPASALDKLRAFDPKVSDPRAELKALDALISESIYCLPASTPVALVPGAFH